MLTAEKITQLYLTIGDHDPGRVLVFGQPERRHSPWSRSSPPTRSGEKETADHTVSS